jgi:hypothetical protein
MPSSIRLHRVLRAPPERVCRAFIDPTAACYMGCQESLVLLGKLVEVDIPDGG